MPQIDKKNIKVLFVDDENPILNIYKMYLDEFNSFFAESGKAALTLIEQQAFDIVVTDYNMPEMNGFQLAEAIKKIAPSTRIILMSAQIDKKLSMEFSNKIHTWNMFDKPVEIDKLEQSLVDAYCDIENEREQKRMATVGKASGKMIHDLGNSFFMMSLSTEIGIKTSTDPQSIEKFEKIKQACETFRQTSEKYKQNLYNMKNEGVIETVVVGEYFEKIGAELKEMVEGHNIKYSQIVDVDPNLIFNLDPHLLRQVIYNLAKNSLDEEKNNPNAFIKLEVNQSADKKTMEMRLIDSGKGICPDVVEKLFNDGFSTKGEKGTGMGLSYAKKLVEAYSGRVWYEPIKYNTCFRIELPTHVKVMNIALPSDIPKTAELNDPSLVNVVNPVIKPDSDDGEGFSGLKAA